MSRLRRLTKRKKNKKPNDQQTPKEQTHKKKTHQPEQQQNKSRQIRHKSQQIGKTQSKQITITKTQKKVFRRPDTGGTELLKLQELLQTERLAFEAEQDALSIIRKQMEDLNKQLQIGIVELMGMNKLMVSLNTIKLDYLLRSEDEINKWKVNLDNRISSTLSTSLKIKYRGMLSELRKNSDFLIKAISATFTLLSPNEMDVLTHSAIFALFGNICNQLEEKKFIDFLIQALEIEFKSYSEPQTLLSQNQALARILSNYTKTTQINRYAVASLREPILSIIQDSSLNLSEKDENKIENISKRLIHFCGDFVESLNNKVPLLPYGIRYFTKKLRKLCNKYNKIEDHNLIIGDFIFLRFLNPMIITPERYNIITDIPILKKDRKKLTEIAKILLSLSRGTSLLRTSNKIHGEKVLASRININSFFENFTNINENNLTKVKHSGNQIMINRIPRSKSIIISYNDILVLHKIVDIYIHQILEKDLDVNQKILSSNVVKYITKLGKPAELVSDNKNTYFSFLIDFILPPPPLNKPFPNDSVKKKRKKIKKKKNKNRKSKTIEKSKSQNFSIDQEHSSKKIPKKGKNKNNNNNNNNENDHLQLNKNLEVSSNILIINKKERGKGKVKEDEKNIEKEKEKEKEKEREREREKESENGKEKEKGKKKEKEKENKNKKQNEKDKGKKKEKEKKKK
ncbi:gtpase-activating protein [Anaeramoeba flamelloides]|uniref:Gtpase-activating protein n=1 Tax=Anaeramoeba flamelloides TaxID=1746091 RepID=A0ABQ8XW99_9EUKA|nr:gtpase-activating protein [Anaeramoeba flamelloides]